ncbi:MAG: hypothetical protein V3S82_10395 [Dehalococcoidia bacterium]
MPNWITDGGFEFQSSAWVLADAGSFFVNDPARAREGSWCLESGGRWNGFTGAYAYLGWFQQQFTTSIARQPRRLRYSIRREIPTSDFWHTSVLLFDGHYPPEGPHLNQIYLKAFPRLFGTPEVYQDIVSDIIVPAGTELTLVVRNTYQPPPGPTELVPIHANTFDRMIYASDDELDALTKRQEIRDAMVTSIQGVTIANGHALDVGEVVTEYRRKDKIVDWPAVQVIYGEEDRAHHELHRKRAELLIHAVCWCKGVGDTFTPEQEADELAAAVETRVETHAGGQYLGLGYVDNVTVEGISPFEADTDMTGGTRLYILDIRVVYRYERGAP